MKSNLKYDIESCLIFILAGIINIVIAVLTDNVIFFLIGISLVLVWLAILILDISIGIK